MQSFQGRSALTFAATLLFLSFTAAAPWSRQDPDRAPRVVVVTDTPSPLVDFLTRFPMAIQVWSWKELEKNPLSGLDALYLLVDLDRETLHGPARWLDRPVLYRLAEFVRGGGGFYVEGVTPRAVPAQKLLGFTRNPGLLSAGILKVVGKRGAGENDWILKDFPSETVWQVRQTGFLDGNAFQAQDEVILELVPAVGTYTVSRVLDGERFPVLIRSAAARGRGYYAALPFSRYAERGFAPRLAWERLLERIVLAPLREDLRDRLLDRTTSFRAWTEPRRWSPDRDVTLVVEGAVDSLSVSGISGAHLDWRRNEPRRREAILNLPEGHHRLKVTGSRNGTVSEAILDFTISSRDQWFRRTVDRSLEWFERSALLRAPDGSEGLLEGFDSGDYSVRDWIRTDCTAQAGLAFFLYGKLTANPRWKQVGENLFQFLFREGFQEMDRSRATFGFWKWGEDLTDYPSVIYSDDNGWAVYAMLRMYQLTAKSEYLERGLATLEGFLETQTPSGLRLRRMEGDILLERGRQWYARNGKPSTDPHYVSQVDVVMLLAYEITGDRRYLESAQRSVDALIQVFPNFETRTALTRATQFAKFVSSPALLYHYTGQALYKGVLEQVLDELRKHQDSSGAIREWGTFRPDNFGDEGPVITSEGEPISDQLYTTNFALLNLQTVCSVLDQPEACDSFVRLADYLSRIQLDSEDPRLNGAWNRAFDFSNWEPFGNNSDPYWGPYAIESGWTNTIISIALMDYLLQQSPFSSGSASRGQHGSAKPEGRITAVPLRQ